MPHQLQARGIVSSSLSPTFTPWGRTIVAFIAVVKNTLFVCSEVLSDLLMAETGPSFNIPQQMLVETVLMASTSHVVKHGSQGVTYINRG